jgi:hypothetical protein
LPASQLPEEAVPWLWPGRLALGKLALLDGDPGLGKSLLTLDLCARLSKGTAFPDGSSGFGPCPTLVLNGEDAVRDTVLPRLRGCGADLDRVFVQHRADGRADELLRFPTDIATLERILAHVRPRLVVIDPLMAFLDRSTQTNNDPSVRRTLFLLAGLAQRHGCAILLVRHLNKREGQRAVYRGGGSIGFVAACRSAWLVARDPDVADRRVLAQLKNNLGPPQPSLAYRVVDQGSGPPALVWDGVSPLMADLLVQRAARPKAPGPRERAINAVEAFLLGGARTTQEVWAEAQRQQISTMTLKRAKKMLGIRSRRVWEKGRQRTYWLLPGQELPPEARKGAVADLEDLLRPLEEKFPMSLPIDEW